MLNHSVEQPCVQSRKGMSQGSRRKVCFEHTVLEEHPTLQLLKRPRKTHPSLENWEEVFQPWLFGVMVLEEEF